MLLIALFLFQPAWADEALRVSSISALNLGVVVSGDPQSIIEPGSAENAQNASFLVEGPRHSAYSIILPPTVVELKSVEAHGRQLRLRDFRSMPSGGGVLDHHGRQMVYVGATRDAVPAGTARGEYRGNFTVVVLY